MPDSRVVIAYDGSERARRAIRAVAALVERADALVLHVGVVPVPPPPGVPAAGPPVPCEPSSEATVGDFDSRALDVAKDGVREAEAAGLAASSLAAAADAGLVVVGSHGHPPLGVALTGSVSSGVLRHATRPVLVVPDPQR